MASFFIGFYVGMVMILSWTAFAVFADMAKNKDCAKSVANWELQMMKWGSLGIGAISTVGFVATWAHTAGLL